MMHDNITLKGRIRVQKFAPGTDPHRDAPAEVIECENLFLTSGINELWSLVVGASANHFDNASVQIGIGDDKATAPADSQTDLQASTNKTYQGMDSGYPATPSNKEVQFKATFGSGAANYEWGEFVVRNATSGISLNRSTNGGAGWGTKTSGTTWVVTATLGIA
jgi:hypothetical protein